MADEHIESLIPPLERFRNAFMNLALPEMPLMLTEPAAAKRNTVT